MSYTARMAERIYMDHAAATPLDERVFSAMQPFWSEHFGNAGAMHKEGRTAFEAVEKARSISAQAIRANNDEIIFTSGGTESNNLAIFGVVESIQERGIAFEDMHIITSAIEHASVTDVFERLEKLGVSVTYIPVSSDGILDLLALKKSIQDNTVLVSIMYSNNEIGTIQPVHEIGRHIAQISGDRATPLYYHIDASQALLFFDCNVEKLHTHLMSFDGQKIYGPKGIGFLYKHRDVELIPRFFGGKQEQHIRPGTPNTPLVVGLGEAVKIASDEREEFLEKVSELQGLLIEKIRMLVPEAKFNGDLNERTPNNVNISLPGSDAEMIVLSLDAQGVACSAKSACLTTNGSNVVRALSKGEEYATSSVRFTFGRGTTEEEIVRVAESLKKVAETIA